MQYDFLPGGNLAVAGGDEIIPLINRLGRAFPHVVMTQDWHPGDHISFASNHPGASPFEVMQLPYGPQVLWPDHCVWDSRGAEFSTELELPQAQMVIRKGYHEVVDSYSAFQEADRQAPRPASRAICANAGSTGCSSPGWPPTSASPGSALDAREAGFETYVIEDATRAIDVDGSLAKAWDDMEGAEVRRIRTVDFA